MKAEAVITGIGIIAPNGIGIDAFWSTLCKGKSGIGPITRFDASKLSSKIAGEVKNFDLTSILSKPVKSRRMARHTQFVLGATELAIKDAGLNLSGLKLDYPIPVVIGVSTNAFDIIEKSLEQFHKSDQTRMSPFLISESNPHAPGAAVAHYLDVPTETKTISTACASGLDAIAMATGMIKSEKADLVITGATDSPISKALFKGFAATGLLSSSTLTPEQASRPFDLQRKGGVIAEGSAIFVIENYEHALARGAVPYATIGGYSSSIDRNHQQPTEGLSKTMHDAISNTGIKLNQIDYICAHGPGDPVIDRIESEMIKKTFGDKAYEIPVSSIKGVCGNPLSAAGPFQVAACALAVKNGLIPPTANYKYRDPDCDLDYVPIARKKHLENILINSHGIGGGNSSLVLERPTSKYLYIL